MRIVLVVVIAAAFAGQLRAQSHDYEERPPMDYQFSEARIDLQVDPEEGTMRGSVAYTIQANRAGADTLILDMQALQVDSVTSDNRRIAHAAGDGQLRIAVTDSAAAGQSFQVEIFYHGQPVFGVLRSSEGTVWTSMLPRSSRHWLPVRDHPRVQMITSLRLRLPEGYVPFASGVHTGEETLPNGGQSVTFRTSRPVPVTSLAFGFGRFSEAGTSVGIKRINSYAEPGSATRSEQARLLERARQLITEIENVTGMEYPYQRLNLVMLQDHYWEQKPYGAGTIFIYENRGPREAQLRRGLYAQWLGVYRHEEQWGKSWPILYLQTALHRALESQPAILSAGQDEPDLNFRTVYDQFSASRWNSWQAYEDAMIGRMAGTLIPAILSNSSDTITPGVMHDTWYRLTGQPLMEVPAFRAGNAAASGTAAADTVRYRVDFRPDAASGSLGLVFRPLSGRMQQPVTLPLVLVTGSGSERTEVTFAGEGDSVRVSMPAGVRNARLEVPEGRALVLEEHKPVPYLLYQLRNAGSTQARKSAALSLGFHTDNPDLQLALNDFMRRDMEPEVEAALLRSYAAITGGAEGTEQRFLDALNSDHPEIRRAALGVLDNYPGRRVTQRLQSFAQNERDTALANRALQHYMQRIDSTAALQYTNQLVQQDTAGTRAIRAIGMLGRAGNSSRAVELAAYYIEPVYDYEVRQRALNVLLEYDDSAAGWAERLDMLLSDYDPRIRFLTLRSLPSIPGVDVPSRLEALRGTVYDARIARMMNR